MLTAEAVEALMEDLADQVGIQLKGVKVWDVFVWQKQW